MYEQVRKFRQTKPIFTMDFWNDGEYAGGCIAGGRRYLHINAGGDVDPCVFIVLRLKSQDFWQEHEIVAY